MSERRWIGGAAIAVGCLMAVGADAQDTTASAYSGYPAAASLEGGDSVVESLSLDDIDVGSVLAFPRIKELWDPWFAWKKRLNDDYGLQLSFSYQTLYQSTNADVPPTRTPSAAAARSGARGRSSTGADRTPGR